MCFHGDENKREEPVNLSVAVAAGIATAVLTVAEGEESTIIPPDATDLEAAEEIAPLTGPAAELEAAIGVLSTPNDQGEHPVIGNQELRIFQDGSGYTVLADESTGLVLYASPGNLLDTHAVRNSPENLLQIGYRELTVPPVPIPTPPQKDPITLQAETTGFKLGQEVGIFGCFRQKAKGVVIGYTTILPGPDEDADGTYRVKVVVRLDDNVQTKDGESLGREVVVSTEYLS